MLFAMQVYRDYREIPQSSGESRIVTIGNFDGVHLGHRAVLERARVAADRQGHVFAVLTFDPHPAELTRPEGPRLRLIEPERKLQLLSTCGVDLALVQRFDAGFAALDPKQFVVDVLVQALRAEMVVVGDNFRFGRERRGEIGMLRQMGEKWGFELDSRQLVDAAESPISSSRIRRLIIEGNVYAARQLLGRWHEVSGTVKRGRGRGRGLGFPTINLDHVQVLIPAPGVYAGYAELEGSNRPAAVYVGDRPTLGHGPALEAHLLDVDQELYGERMVLGFVERVRGDQRFENAEALARQIGQDVELIRRLLENQLD